MWANMVYSDRFVIESIKALSRRDDLTVKEIAAHADVPLGTAKDALSRLMKSGQVVREGRGRRWGSRYQVVEPAK
jgi:DNA-binding IclR family transcriptional regulator